MSIKIIFAIFGKIEKQKRWFVKSAWHNRTSSRVDKSRNKLHSVVFLSRNGGFLYWKRWFYRQETTVLAPRNGGSWNWFFFLSASKKSIILIINIFHVMPKISVFCHRTATRWQISALRAVRTVFLLSLFASIVGAWFITFRLLCWVYFMAWELWCVFTEGDGTWWITLLRMARLFSVRGVTW